MLDKLYLYILFVCNKTGRIFFFFFIKEYNGPEFICRGRKPLVKLNMPLSGEVSTN